MIGNFSQAAQDVKNTIESFRNSATGSVTVEAKNRLGDLVGKSAQTLNNLATNLTQ